MLAAISRSREGSLVSQPITTRPADGSLFVKASFLAVIPNDGSPEAAYATYEVVSEEGDQRWATVCRWSDLRRLHDELDSRCAAQMKVARSAGLPSFWHHTLRLGKARISPEFCAGRAREMTKLLQTLVRTLGVSLLKECGPKPLISFLGKGVDVTLATPMERWFSVEHGWPACVFDNTAPELRPRSLTPSRAEAPSLYPEPAAAIGELFVEVLEAAAIPRVDTLSQNDVYAILFCEGHAAKTTTLADMEHPRWQYDDARAARFPVSSVYSTLFVALFDADFGSIDADDELGRVTIDLRLLRPSTVYTAWLELGRKALADGSEGLGRVRLRYSLRWASDRARVCRYLAPPDDVVVPAAPTHTGCSHCLLTTSLHLLFSASHRLRFAPSVRRCRCARRRICSCSSSRTPA